MKEVPKIWGRWVQLLEASRGWRPRNTRVIIPNFVALRQTVLASAGDSKKLGTLWPRLLGMGLGWPSKTRYSSTRVTIPNVVAVGQTVWSYVGCPKMFLGTLGLASSNTLGTLEMWACLTPIIWFSPTRVTLPNLVILGQTLRA